MSQDERDFEARVIEAMEGMARESADKARMLTEAMALPHPRAREAIVAKARAELAELDGKRAELAELLERHRARKPITVEDVDVWYGEFVRLTGYDPKASFDQIAGDDLTLFNPHTRVFNIGGQLSKRALFRELARGIEFDVPEMSVAAKSFRDARVRAGVPFIEPEMAADYGPDDPGTEIIARGIEYFVSPDLMAELYRQDPEHFTFIMGVIETLKKP